MSGQAWEAVDGGLRVRLRVTPRGGRDGLDGVAVTADGRAALRVRVAAAASDGEANEAACRLLARILKLAPGRVRLAAGHTARIKSVVIAGDPEGLETALGAAARAAQGERA